jgi:hypothetical protein
MAKGLCVVKGGWHGEDSVWVEYEDDPTRQYEVPVSQYNLLGYQPPLESLPIRGSNGMPPDN